MTGEIRKTGERIVASAALAAALGLAACTQHEAGMAMPATTITASSEQQPPTGAPLPDEPPAMTQLLTNMPGEQPFAFDVNTYPPDNSPTASRLRQYDYGPSVMATPDGKLKMWWCGGGGTGKHGGDSIWYSESAQQGNPRNWSAPVEVIKPSDDPASLDYAHTCDPSVVRIGDYNHIFYTGATDRAPDGGTCNGSQTADGCDNRIFIARVAVDATGDPASYQKLANTGNCAQPECFDWQPSNSAPNALPVPVIRNPNEDAPVWRRGGSGPGVATQQTKAYGVGQPSAVNIDGQVRIWYTNVSETDAVENVAAKPADNMDNAFAAQDQQGFSRDGLSNAGNHVNYDVGFDAKNNRYVVTVAEEHPEEPTSPLSRPRIGVAQHPGENAADLPAPIMSARLGQKACDCYVGNTTDTHNSGFLRDEYGRLATMPGPNGSGPYNWVYYGTNRSNMAESEIHRTAFTLNPHS